MDCPCKNCNKKGCGTFHDKCEPYLAYREENDVKSKEKAKALDVLIPKRPYRTRENSPLRCHEK